MWRESRYRIARFGFSVVAAMVACSLAWGQEVRTNYMPNIDFSKYHTYKWVTITTEGQPDEILDAQIKQAIDSQLAAKGLTRVDSDKPDLLIGYQAALTQEKQWDAYGWGDNPWFGGWGGWGSARGTATSSTIPVGNLVLQIYDPAIRHLVWIGLATQTLDPSKDPDKNQKKLNKAMQKLLKTFPPKQK